MSSKLEVKNLRISFKTNRGMVKAVRGINFNLDAGETLAIVGESGSGKSVTSKAILGILPGNSIVEEGEILYEGIDLLKCTESMFNKLRGNKITMIFQDPMSSLNPIMKIGRQMTEATLLNSKTNCRNAAQEFKEAIRCLKKSMIKAGCDASEVKYQVKAFLKYTKKISRMEHAYDLSFEYAESCMMTIERLYVYLLEKNDQRIIDATRKLRKKMLKAQNIFLIPKDDPEWRQLKNVVYHMERKYDFTQYDRYKCDLMQLEKYLKQKLNHEKPDFLFRSGITEDFINSFRNNISSALQFQISKTHHSADLTSDVLISTDDIINNLFQLSYRMNHRISGQEAYDKAIRIMEDVGIKDPERRFRQYPFEFSGGMRQRIVIAIALAANPDILICDEPTTALDVTIQAQILELINELKKKKQLTVIFISHDLGVVANMADRVAVMYAGKIVEIGTVEDIFYHPAHPYTWALLASMPDLDTQDKLEAIPGSPPDMVHPPLGDAFAARNQYAMKIDFEKEPPFFQISETHYAATWLLHPHAPAVEPPKQIVQRIIRMKKREVNHIVGIK